VDHDPREAETKEVTRSTAIIVLAQISPEVALGLETAGLRIRKPLNDPRSTSTSPGPHSRTTLRRTWSAVRKSSRKSTQPGSAARGTGVLVVLCVIQSDRPSRLG
jgi:hypothetical protein